MEPPSGMRSARRYCGFPFFSLIAVVLFSWKVSKFADTSPAKQVAIRNLRVAKTHHSSSPRVDAMPWISAHSFSRNSLEKRDQIDDTFCQIRVTLGNRFCLKSLRSRDSMRFASFGSFGTLNAMQFTQLFIPPVSFQDRKKE